MLISTDFLESKYTGPVRTIEFDEGMGVKSVDEPPAPKAPA